MPERHKVVPRAMCFVFHKDEVLLMKASSKKEWEGFYSPIGGHIEKNETIIEGATREIKEESGLDLVPKLRGIVHASNFFGREVMLFVTSSRSDTKEVKGNDEGTLEWVKIDDLDKIKIFEDIKPMLDKVMELDEGEIFVGKSEFDGKDKLVSIDIRLN